MLCMVRVLVLALCTGALVDGKELAGSKPNIIVILADDLGYGDLGWFGHPTSDTPALNQLVQDGIRFVDMYSASPVCSPSRSAILSGRWMTRTGVWPGVFSPYSIGGLAINETLLPTILKDVGYDSLGVGKWHLGVGEEGKYLPVNRGFDSYVGVPYGVDMCSLENAATQYVGGQANMGGRPYEVPCPLIHNTTIVEQPTQLLTLDDKYVEATTDFIKAHAEEDSNPFFIYFCSHHTHAPAFTRTEFTNTSMRGWFGDHLRALDWSVQEIVAAVDNSGLGDNTLILFSADNGPSLTFENLGGNNGPMRCGKGTTWEGGQRVPGIARWTNTISPNVISHDIVSSMDFYATAIELSGATAPQDRTIDSISFVDVLEGKSGKRTEMYYWGSSPSPTLGLHAVRSGAWKLHWITQGSHCNDNFPDKECPSSKGLNVLPEPLLYNLDVDVGEVYNFSLAAYPQIVENLTQMKHALEAQHDIFGPSQVNKGKNESYEPCASSCGPTDKGWPLCCHT